MEIGRRVKALVDNGDLRSATQMALVHVGPRVRRHLEQALREAASVDEAFSRFSEKLWTGLRRYRCDAPLVRWALRVAASAARDLQRDGWRRRRAPLPPEEDLPASPPPGAERQERDEEILDRLRSGLSPRDRSLLALRLERRLPWREIALLLSSGGEALSAEAARKRFERLRARLSSLARRTGSAG